MRRLSRLRLACFCAALSGAFAGAARAKPTGAAAQGIPRARPDQPITVSRLLAAYAEMPGLEARFVETKRLALLAQPLVNRGRLFFARPGLLLRRVEAPHRSEVLITQDAVHVRAPERQTIPISRLEQLGGLVHSLLWLLAGDEAALSRTYRLSLSGGSDAAEPWELVLEPRAEALARLVERIRVRGRGLAVSEVHVREASGDETVTRIVEANPSRRFDAAERRELFAAPTR